MNNPDTEILFPLRVVSDLRAVRGKEWDMLSAYIQSGEAQLLDQLAYVLVIVRIAGCVSCNSDSFRAMRGCTQCSIQAVRRHRVSDDELLQQYEGCRIEVREYIQKQGYDVLLTSHPLSTQ